MKHCVYRVIECKGPTNTRVYTVAVYFRGRRLASAMGHSIQQAEMNAAKKALEISQGNEAKPSPISFIWLVDLFPQLDHQKRVIAKSMKKQKNKKRSRSGTELAFGRRGRSPESYSRRRFKRSRSRSSDSDSSPRCSTSNSRSYDDLSDDK